MNDLSAQKALSVTYISRTFFILAILLILSAGGINLKILIPLSTFFLFVSWIMPGILIIFRLPWFAQSWLRGINTILIPSEPWEKLSTKKRFLVYFYSMLLSVSALVTLTGIVIQYNH